jgi:hypothetical protein
LVKEDSGRLVKINSDNVALSAMLSLDVESDLYFCQPLRGQTEGVGVAAR